jgi:hypothetical protein
MIFLDMKDKELSHLLNKVALITIIIILILIVKNKIIHTIII